jgi:hemoglobin
MSPTTPSTLTPGAELDRAGVRDLVHAFYDDVRADALLGPVFAQVIGDDWAPHLARMVEFWSTVMLGTRSFRGNVYGKHVQLAQQIPTTPEHFLRWLTLWHRHTSARFEPGLAEEFQATAQGIGRNLFHGFFGQFALFELQDGVATGWAPDPSIRLPQ